MGLITLLMLPPRATQRIKIRLVTALVNAALNKHLKTNTKMEVAPPFKLLVTAYSAYLVIWPYMASEQKGQDLAQVDQIGCRVTG